MDVGQKTKNQPLWAQEIAKISKQLLAKIAELSPNDEQFTTADLVLALEDSENILHWEVVALLDRLLTSAQRGIFRSRTNQFLMDKIPELMQNVKRIDPQNIKLGGGDRAIPNIPISGRYGSKFGGQTPALLQQIFDVAGTAPLKGRDSLQARMERLNDLSKSITKKDIGTRTVEENLAGTIVIDYLRRVVQDYEASAGGFLFENFLALLLSGTKEGGNVRIEDFTWPKGTGTQLNYGSAKLYKTGTKKYSGSKKLVRLLIDRGVNIITYLLAAKGDSLDAIEVFKDDVLVGLDKRTGNYFMMSKMTGDRRDLGPPTMTEDVSPPDSEGVIDAESEEELDEKNQWQLPWPSKSIATINLGLESELQASQDTAIKDFLNKAGVDLGNLISTANNFMVNMTDTFTKPVDLQDQSSVTAKLDSYQKTLKTFLDLRGFVLSSFQGLGQGGYEWETGRTKGFDKTAQRAAAEKLEESVTLDQLIESVMKGILNETK